MARDARYRDDQPFHVGAEVWVLHVPNDSLADYQELCMRNGGTNPARATVTPIGETIFHGHVPVMFVSGEQWHCQWPEEHVIPVDEAPVTEGRKALEAWLDD